MTFRVHDLLVCQTTQLINAVRVGEFGLVVSQGAARAKELIAMVADLDTSLPGAARPALKVMAPALPWLKTETRSLEAEIARRAKENETARRPIVIPGVGSLIATALVAPPPHTVRCGRDFAAWLGLMPCQHSIGGEQRPAATTKVGERSLRRLPVIGADSLVIKRGVHKDTPPSTWAGWPAAAQAAYARAGGSRQQDGAGRVVLVATCEGRSLLGSGRGGVRGHGCEGVGV